MNYKIVADSSSDLLTLSGVPYEAVPLKIITREREYVDEAGLDVEAMVEDLRRQTAPTGTSCPNVHDWISSFGDADLVFAITITSNLSGSYNAALQAAGDFKRANPEKRICVLDTLSAGPEMQLIVEKLQELIEVGGTFEEIRTAIRAYMKHTHLLFALQSLDNLAKNGRCSMALAKVAGVLGIRVVGKASDHGTLEPISKPRGEKKALEAVLSELAKAGFRGGKVRIAHCFNEKSAKELKKMILDCFPGSDIQIHPCGGLCSYYADLGGYLIGFEDGI